VYEHALADPLYRQMGGCDRVTGRQRGVLEPNLRNICILHECLECVGRSCWKRRPIDPRRTCECGHLPLFSKRNGGRGLGLFLKAAEARHISEAPIRGMRFLGPGSPPSPRLHQRSLPHLVAALQTTQAVVVLGAATEALGCTKRTGVTRPAPRLPAMYLQ
jgi:hypothetical protein